MRVLATGATVVMAGLVGLSLGSASAAAGVESGSTKRMARDPLSESGSTASSTN